jgi:hypothetical protein
MTSRTSFFRRATAAAVALATVTTVVATGAGNAAAAVPTPTVKYEFDSALTDSVAGSTLTQAAACPVGGYTPCNSSTGFGSDANGTYWGWTSTSRAGGGFSVQTASPVGTTYTMSLQFSLANVAAAVNGYSKVVDYRNRTSDDGFYFHFGRLKFFPGSGTSAQSYAANEVLNLVTVRQATGATTGTFTVYMVGADKRLTRLFTYDDVTGGAVPIASGSGSKLGFFFDDAQSGSENFEASPGGKVYSLQLWSNRALTTAELEDAVLPPAAPTNLTAAPGDTQATAAWDAVPGATSYTVTAAPGGATCTAVAPATTCDVTGLTNGQLYSFTVVASDANGASASSAPATATPRTTPGAPTALAAEAGDGAASVAFTEPSDGGSPITNYEYSLDGGAWTAFSPVELNAPVTIDGLTNGTTYSVRLRAVNAVGAGPASAPVDVTPVPGPTPPGPPVNLVATPGDGQATITFTAGADGGSPLTNYEYTTDGGLTWTAFGPADAASPVTLTGLTNGTTYEVVLRAVNALGKGEPSEAVTVTPRTLPGAPTGLSAEASDGTAEITFTPPDDGGSAITNYQYRVDGGPWQDFSPTTASSPGLVRGLTDGATVSVEVRAVNAAGAGPASDPVAVTPVARGTAPVWSDAVLGRPVVGRAFNDGVSATGTAPISYVVTGGRLPAGLSLNAATGAVSGTPTATGPALFIITATNSFGSVTQGFGMEVTAARTGVLGAVSFVGQTGRLLPEGRRALDLLAAAVPSGATNVQVQVFGWAEAKRTTRAVLQLGATRVRVTTAELKRRGVAGSYTSKVGGKYPVAGKVGRRSEVVITWDN